MKSQALRYYMHDGPSAFRFELAGEIDNEGARELGQAWWTASSVVGDSTLIVDLTFVTNAGEEGRSLLARWHAEGAQLVAKSKVSRELAESIVGERLPDFVSAGKTRAHRTWLPFYACFLLACLLLPADVHAASLKTETVAAWNDYVQSVSITQQDRVRPSGNFLWTYENSRRIAKVLSGEIVVAPAPGPNPRRVPGGLIHHWIGAAFLPNAKLNDILDVTQDYDRYKEFYQPSVVESKTMVREKSEDRFSMLLMNQAFFLKTALDADYQATKVHLHDRFYSVSRTTRMQEIEDYGRPLEHRIPEGEGSGLIWKLFSIVRLAERDGGVYIEIEAVALSREIPGALHLVVDPLVRRVSRSSMLTSIQQTEDAVRRNSLARATPAGSPAAAEHLRSVSAAIQDNTSAFSRVR